MIEFMGTPHANRAKKDGGLSPRWEPIMAKSQKKSNKEVRKPKAEKTKTIAANASTKDKPVAMVNLNS